MSDITDIADLAKQLRSWREAGQYQRVLSETTPLIDGGVTDSGLLLQHALSLVDAGALEPAVEVLARLTETNEAASIPTSVVVEAGTFGWHAAYRLGQTDRAAAWLDRALELEPDNADTLEQYATLKFYQRDYEAAFMAFHAVHQKRPLSIYGMVLLRPLCRALGVWGMLERLDEIVRKHVEAAANDDGVTLLEGSTLALLATDDDAHLALVNHQLAEKYLGDINLSDVATRSSDVPLAALDPGRQLSIGYLLSHHRHHPVLDLVRNMFRHHDREQFEVTALVLGGDRGGPANFDLDAQFDRVVNLKSDSPNGLAAQISGLGLDIVIDLDGFAHDNPILPALALRPAPVSVTWLGYPGPIPAKLVDYQIVDHVIVPEGAADSYNAALAYMPHTYKVLNEEQAITDGMESPFRPDQFVFGCFCGTAKIQPGLFGQWMQILIAVPNAVLWLQEAFPLAQKNFKAAAEKAGVDGERLVFAKRVQSKADHLGRLRHVDVGLDTWRYGGHVSTIDMLMAGVPVIAKRGTHFASRASQSILRAADLEILIADDADGYRNLAVALATNPDRFEAVKASVQQAQMASKLFDPRARVGELEQLYRQMWLRHCQGDAPANIHLS